MDPVTVELSFGIFSSIGLFVSSIILKQFQQHWFSTFLMSVVAGCLTLFVWGQTAHIGEVKIAILFDTAMFLLFLISIGTFWHVMQYTQ
jgi:hypothetical protein